MTSRDTIDFQDESPVDMMRLPDENSPLITLVIMSITYHKLVGMDMES